MQERRDADGRLRTAKAGDQLLCEAMSGVVRMRTDGAELAVACKPHAFAGHGDKPAIAPDAIVVPQKRCIGMIITGLDTGDQPIHFVMIGLAEPDDLFLRLRHPVEIRGGEQLGAGELGFDYPMGRQGRHFADDVEGLAGRHQVIEFGYCGGAGAAETCKGQKVSSVPACIYGSLAKSGLFCCQGRPGWVIQGCVHRPEIIDFGTLIEWKET